MTADVLATPTRRPVRRATPARLVGRLTGHAITAFFRNPMAAFLTLVLPLVFLLIVGAAVGNQVVDGGVRVAQFLVAPMAVFGVTEAAFCVLAIDTAVLRENGVLKRLHGTPAPAWAVLASRVASAVVVSLLAVAVLLGVGVTAYGVKVVWRAVPAALVTLLVGIACFAALGLALVALTRSVLAAQALSNAVLIPLAFISNVFIVGADLPAALDWLGRVLPLRHFADALAATFDPRATGPAFAAGDLAVMAGWGAAAALVAWWRFGWEPRRGTRARTRTRPEPAQPEPAQFETTGTAQTAALSIRQPGRPSRWALLRGQVGHALTGLRRDLLSVFFAVVFPVMLLLLFPVIFPGARVHGMPLAHVMVPGMITYAVAFAAFATVPETIAEARSRGVLERLRGSPLPRWLYLAGQVASALLVAALAAVVLVAVAAVRDGFRPDPARLPAAVLAFGLAVACFAALGVALLALLPSARSLTAVTLGTLLPLSFVSDVFLFGAELPGWLQGVGDTFPLKHVMYALLAALGPAGPSAGFAWGHLAVVAAWTAGALLVARTVRAQPSAPIGRRLGPTDSSG